ncbi:ATP-dependent Clp protease adaptor ClpS [Saccharomonospora piscinae]|uniref:ATP-dependent Clp protease adaptor ClpS n=1 Tax=Saccharomonospora piscinae TaxID=687388 RepID=UPI00207BA4E1|nr:ATP-dependent Clp protease adaptor ClpS [Saccharomonospora piscinae]
MTDETATDETVTDDGTWGIDLHADDVTRFPGVAFVLWRVCGLSPEAGVALADEAQRHGTVRVLDCRTREEAERVVAEIQVLGVRATAATATTRR